MGNFSALLQFLARDFIKENSLLAILWDQQMQWSPLKNRHTTPSKFQSINKNTRHRLDTLVHSHIKKFLIETLRWDKKAFYVKPSRDLKVYRES